MTLTVKVCQKCGYIRFSESTHKTDYGGDNQAVCVHCRSRRWTEYILAEYRELPPQ